MRKHTGKDKVMKKQRNYGGFILLLFIILLGVGIVRNWPLVRQELEERGIPVFEELPSDKAEFPDSTQSLPLTPALTDETDTFRSENYYYSQLDETAQGIYLQILDAVQKREESVQLLTNDSEQLDMIYHGLLKDHPEIFWIHNRREVYKTTYKYRKDCIFTPTYLYTQSEMQEIRRSMEDAFREVSGLIPEGADDYRIVETVYTFLIDETEYRESEDDQSIAGVFWKKQAVCAGYAGAVQYLLGRLGIPCIYIDGDVSGRAEGHAWNQVLLHGEWYYVDATNGDQPEFLSGDFVSLAEHKTILMDYLCPFPEEYEQNYHASAEFSLPACSATDENFYVRNQGIFEYYDWQSVYDYCCMRINNNAAVVRFKFSPQDAFAAAVNDWIGRESLQEVAQYYMQRNGLRQIEYHYGVLEDLKTIYFIF